VKLLVLHFEMKQKLLQMLIHLHSHLPSKVVENRFSFLLAKLNTGRVLRRLGQNPLILAADDTAQYLFCIF